MSTEFEWTEEQRALREVVDDFCTRRAPAPGAGAPGFDRDTWQALAGQLSVAGLTVSPDLGGAGATLIEAGVVAEALGRALLPTPLVPTVGLAVTALAHCTRDDEARTALTAIAEGTVVATAALTDEAGALDPGVPPLSAREQDGRWHVDGTSAFVLEGATSDVVLCLAAAEDGPALLLVRSGATGLHREDVVPLDQGRSQARLTFDRVPATRLHPDEPVARVVEDALAAAAALLAMEQIGIARAVHGISVEHARTRIQFGRAIGSFQAVKHRLADMYVEVENARSTGYHALWAHAEGVDDPRVASSLAFVTASDAARAVTKGAVQVHGGIGFTWEHPVHWYLKAAASNAVLLGGDRLHARRLADLVLNPTPSDQPTGSDLEEVGA